MIPHLRKKDIRKSTVPSCSSNSLFNTMRIIKLIWVGTLQDGFSWTQDLKSPGIQLPDSIPQWVESSLQAAWGGFSCSSRLRRQITRNVFSLLLCVSTHLVCCRQVQFAAPKKILHLMMQVWAKQHKDCLIHSLIPVVVRLSRSNSEIFLSFFKREKWSKLRYFSHQEQSSFRCRALYFQSGHMLESLKTKCVSSSITLMQSVSQTGQWHDAVDGRPALYVQVHMYVSVCVYACAAAAAAKHADNNVCRLLVQQEAARRQNDVRRGWRGMRKNK